MTGSTYKSWKWVTRQEGGEAKRSRMLQMIDACKTKFGMAWDYQGFERQVKTIEMMEIVSNMGKRGEHLIPHTDQGEWDELYSLMLSSFNKSVIITPDGKEIDVTGGLPSGLYLTSIVGDAIGLSAAEAARTMAIMLDCPPIDDEDIKIQGDDASYMHKAVVTLQVIDWCLSRMNWIAGSGKFGIVNGSTEFLRVSYDTEGAHGYLARSIASITQRKPWSDAPASDIESIQATIDGIETCNRRGHMSKNLKDIILRIWCHKKKVSYIRARVPQISGGLGLSEPIASIRYTKLEQVEPKAKAIVKTHWRRDRLIAEAAEWGIDLPERSANELVQSEILSVCIADNVKGLTKGMRLEWDKQLAIPQKPNVMPHLMTYATTEFDFDNVNSSYGQFRREEERLQSAAKFDVKLNELRRVRFPTYYWEAVKLGKRIGMRDAISWFSGSLPTYIDGMNPIVTELITTGVANQVRLGDVPKNRLVDVWLGLARKTVEGFRKHKCYSISQW